ncbi:MAG: hypothetical protein KDD44_07100 [Bdellovibrionales bacterium]|nr:hypothetical protein [Bdellovibrionales bacterium]
MVRADPGRINEGRDAMRGLEQELDYIDGLVATGLACLEKGDTETIDEITRQLRSSWAVGEAARGCAMLEGVRLLGRKNSEQAKQRCLEDISYLWDDPDGFAIIRRCHPPASLRTRLYDILIRGGSAVLRPVGQFTNDHLCRFLVAAENADEVIGYISELCGFQDVPALQILEILSRLPVSSDLLDRSGVYRSSCFSIDTVPSRFLSGAVDSSPWRESARASAWASKTEEQTPRSRSPVT